MNNKLREAAERYNDGLLAADEFLGLIMVAIHERYERLKQTRVNHATRDTALDVDNLSRVLADLKI